MNHCGNEILFSNEEDKITPEEFAVSYMTVYTRYKEDTPSDATKLPHWLGKLCCQFYGTQKNIKNVRTPYR